VGAGSPVVVIGADRAPTSALVSELHQLGYRAELVPWPASELPPRSLRPAAVLFDLRTLGVHAASALHAARRGRAARDAVLIGVVPEHEAARLDLALGFDDLLLAPYRVTELAARLRLAHWRSETASSSDLLRAGPLTLNQSTYQVSINRRPVDLTLQEYRLLLFLLRNPGRVFSREELLARVWGQEYFGGTRTVDVHVRRLRAKTEAAGELIETVRGVGYRLAPPDSE